MKNKLLYIIFSVLFVGCIASHNITNHKIPCDEERWVVLSGKTVNGALAADEGNEGRILETRYYSLNQGDYTVTIKFYSSAPGTRLIVEAVDRPYMTVDLPASEDVEVLEIPVSLDRDYVDFRIYIEKTQGSSLAIWEIDIASEKPVNQDFTYLAVLAALVLVSIYYLIFIRRRPISSDTFFSVLVLAAACILISGPMFRVDLYEADDLGYHIYKIEGMRDAIKNGQFPVYFYPYTFNGYGYINVLYPSFFFYPAVFLRILGVSSITCYKSFMFAVNLGTAWIAYCSAKRLLGRSRWAPLLFSLLYLLAPYRINNLWVRAAVGELLATMFLPFILLGLYELLVGDRKKWWYLAIGYSGLIQSHVLSCLMILILSVVIGIFYVDIFFKEKRWIELLKIIGCLLVFNAWYLIPFLVYIQLDLNLSKLHMEWDLHVMNLAEVFQSYKAGIPGTYEWRSNSLGLSGMICLALGVAGVLVKKEKDQKQKFLSVLLVYGVVFTVLTTNMVPWELLRRVSVIDWVSETIQFPWRFLTISNLCLLSAGVGWLYENGVLKPYRLAISAIMVLAVVFAMWDVTNLTASKGIAIPPDRPQVKTPPEYILKGSDNSDYRNIVYLSDEEKVEVQDYMLEASKAKVWLVCKEKGQYIEAPMFNYPGYKAFGKDGTLLPVETGSNNRVRVRLSPSEQVQEITVRFVGENIFLVGYGVTLVAVIWALCYINREKLRQRIRK